MLIKCQSQNLLVNREPTTPEHYLFLGNQQYTVKQVYEGLVWRTTMLSPTNFFFYVTTEKISVLNILFKIRKSIRVKIREPLLERREVLSVIATKPTCLVKNVLNDVVFLIIYKYTATR